MSRRIVCLLVVLMLVLPVAPAAAQDGCPTLAARLTVGGQGRVTAGTANRMRSEPSTSSQEIGQIPGEGVFTVIDGPVCAEGYRWWRVTYQGLSGWTAEGDSEAYFVEPILVESLADLPELLPQATWGLGYPLDTAWSPDAIAVAGSAGVWLYDPNNLEAAPRPLGQYEYDSSVISVAFDPSDPDLLATASEGRIIIRNVTSGEVVMTLESGTGGLFHLAYSADGAVLMARSGLLFPYNDERESLVFVWNADSGEPLLQELGAGTNLTQAALSPEGRQVLTGDREGNLRLWDVATGQIVRDDFPYDGALDPSWIYAVAFSPDGTRIAASNTNFGIHIWSLVDGSHLEFEHPYEGDPWTPQPIEIVFLPDGRLLTADDPQQGGVRLFEIDGGITMVGEIVPGEGSRGFGITVSPDGSAFAAIMTRNYGGIRTVEIVDLAAFSIGTTLDGYEPMSTVTLSPDGGSLLTQGGGALLRYDTDTGTLEETLPYEGLTLYRVASTADAARIAGCVNLSAFSWEPDFMMWSPMETDEGFTITVDETEPVYCLVPFFLDNTLYFLTSRGLYRSVGVSTFERVLPFEEDLFSTTAAIGGNVLAFNRPDGVQVYDLVNLAGPRIIPWTEGETNANTAESVPLALDSAGMLLARRNASTPGTVEIFNLSGETPVFFMSLPGSSSVTAIAFSQNAEWLAVGYADGTVFLWNIFEGRSATLRGATGAVESLIFSPDGGTLYGSGGDDTVRVWDISGVQ